MLKAIDLVQSGVLGTLQSLEAVFDVPIAYSETELRWQKALGGGSLMDLGTYCLHAVRMLAQSEPTVQSASAQMQHGVDAALEATLAFGGGVTAKISSSMVPNRMLAQLTAIGSLGRLDITNFIAPQIGCRSALTLGGRGLPILTRVVAPFVAPQVLDTYRINMASAWNLVIVAELVAATEGLGKRISLAQRFLRTDDIFVGLIVIGLVGLVIDLGFRFLMRKACSWAN
jgi:predicted dehydrogenase